MPVKVSTCAKCATALDPAATGRPPRFCSTMCRSAANYEVRRIDRRLAKLEAERATWERRAATRLDEHGQPWPRIRTRSDDGRARARAMVTRLDVEVAAEDARLGALLGAGHSRSLPT